MRFSFVALCALLLACAPPAGPKKLGGLPGFPLAGPGEADGPDHRQSLVEVTATKVVILESLESDGRPKRQAKVEFNRHGEVVQREQWSKTDELDEAFELYPLPYQTDAYIIEVRRKRNRLEVWLCSTRGDPVEARLALLPRARSTRVLGLAPDPGQEDEGLPSLAALIWQSKEGAARVDGVAVLDLLGAKASIQQRRGIAAHRREDFEAAARHFARAWQTDPEEAVAAYNKACALTRLGKYEQAMFFLGAAIALDDSRIRVFAARDPDLDPLRDHPDFARLVGPGGSMRSSVEEQDASTVKDE